MDEHIIKYDTETGRNREQVNKIKHIVSPNPKEKQGTSLVWSPIMLQRKLPMAWGVRQQIEKPQKSIPSQYVREIQHLTLKDLKKYLILDG